jgi:hypothetical protein
VTRPDPADVARAVDLCADWTVPGSVVAGIAVALTETRDAALREGFTRGRDQVAGASPADGGPEE